MKKKWMILMWACVLLCLGTIEVSALTNYGLVDAELDFNRAVRFKASSPDDYHNKSGRSKLLDFESDKRFFLHQDPSIPLICIEPGTINKDEKIHVLKDLEEVLKERLPERLPAELKSRAQEMIYKVDLILHQNILDLSESDRYSLANVMVKEGLGFTVQPSSLQAQKLYSQNNRERIQRSYEQAQVQPSFSGEEIELELGRAMVLEDRSPSHCLELYMRHLKFDQEGFAQVGPLKISWDGADRLTLIATEEIQDVYELKINALNEQVTEGAKVLSFTSSQDMLLTNFRPKGETMRLKVRTWKEGRHQVRIRKLTGMPKMMEQKEHEAVFGRLEQILPGAKMQIEKWDDKHQTATVIQSFTSNQSVQSFDLEPGLYRLLELEAPFGYQLAQAIEFEVPKSQEDSVQELAMTDDPETFILKAKKHFREVLGSDCPEDVPRQVQFELLVEHPIQIGAEQIAAGTLIKRIELNIQAEDQELLFEVPAPGDYLLRELPHPYYESMSDWHIAVADWRDKALLSGKTRTLQAEQTFENRIKKGKIVVLKCDPQGQGLAGAKFRIYQGALAADASEETRNERYLCELESNTEGLARTELLPYGVYTICETKAPNGYQLKTEPWQLELKEAETESRCINHRLPPLVVKRERLPLIYPQAKDPDSRTEEQRVLFKRLPETGEQPTAFYIWPVLLGMTYALWRLRQCF